MADEVIITDCSVGFVVIAVARNTGIVLFHPEVAIALGAHGYGYTTLDCSGHTSVIIIIEIMVDTPYVNHGAIPQDMAVVHISFSTVLALAITQLYVAELPFVPKPPCGNVAINMPFFGLELVND